jgi:hypothetical protein
VTHEDGLLSVKYKLLGLMPIRVGIFDKIRLSTATVNGRHIIVGKLGEETQVFGEKLRPAPIPDNFRKLIGKYEIINKNDGPTPDKILLKEELGQLVGELSFPEKPELTLRIAFQPVSENEAITAGLGNGRGDTLRVFKQDGEDRIAFSGLQLRKILN